MSHLNATLLHRGKQSGEFEGHPPVLRLTYKYAYPFATIAGAYLKKNNWENRTSLTTIASVEQVDDDTLVYYRRLERYTHAAPGWEKITVNRKDQTMVTEALSRNTDGSIAIMDQSKFWAQDGHTQNEMEVFATVAKSFKVEQYKSGIEMVVKAIKFSAFEA
jgi:hypothetical protein